jgi:hypothetical protein
LIQSRIEQSFVRRKDYDKSKWNSEDQYDRGGKDQQTAVLHIRPQT